MKNPSQLLPLKFGSLQLTKIKWSQFQGEVNDDMPWSAHVFWWIDYQIIDYKTKTVSTKVNISPKSWVKPEKKSAHLLNHQQGHYLIGSMCALQFLRRIDSKVQLSKEKFEDLVTQTFDRTMKEYLQLEKKYDNQTQHRLNYQKQAQWDAFIWEKLIYYSKIYDQTLNKFVKLSESPLRKKKIDKSSF